MFVISSSCLIEIGQNRGNLDKMLDLILRFCRIDSDLAALGSVQFLNISAGSTVSSMC